MSRILVEGQYLVTEGIAGQYSDENGLQTLSVPVSYPTLALALSMDPAKVALAMGLNSGLKLVSSPLKQNELMHYTVTYTFQGVSQTWDFAAADAAATFSLTGTEGEAPIAAHPNFAALKAKYGWDPDMADDPDGPGHFPYRKPGGAISPAYGVQGWLVTGAEFQKVYVLRSVPSQTWSQVGEIFANPPDLMRAFGLVTQQSRKWIKLAPNLERNLGSATRVTERYRLTGPDPQNVIRDIYNYAGSL
jgi:hypothetical protein